MVDYAKWDRIGDSSDDEESARKSKPEVHRFNGPQSVTLGGPGRGVQVSPQVSSSAQQQGRGGNGEEPGARPEDAGLEDDDEPMEPPDEDPEKMLPDEDRREDVLQCRALAERALRRGDAAEGVRLLEKAMHLGGQHCPGLGGLLSSARRQLGAAPGAASAGIEQAGEPRAGQRWAVGDRYCWSQTRDTVEVNVFVAKETKAKAVAIDVSETRVCINIAGAKVLEGEWEFKIEPEDDPDWEVRSCDGRRAVRLTVRKAAMPGGFSVVVWWTRLLKGEPGIDARKIEGRKTEPSENFAKAWEEAHAAFREKVRTRTPIEVDTGGRGADEGSTGIAET